MTEAELRRLAELVNQLSQADTGPTFNYWEIMVAFVAGILVNSFSEWLRAYLTRRAVLRTARISLYRNLVEYRTYMNTLLTQTPPTTEAWGFTIQRLDDIRQRLRTDLISVDDRKYSRWVAKAMLRDDSRGFRETVAELDRIITRLERDALPLFENLEKKNRAKYQPTHKR